MYNALVYVFGSYMLIEKGFSTSSAGIIISIGNLIGLCLQPLTSNISDNSKTLTVIDVTMVLATLSLLATTLNVIALTPTVFAAIAYIVIISSSNCAESLYNCIHIFLQENDINVSFSTARSLGSITYGISSSILGVLFSKMPFNIALAYGPIITFILIICLFFLRKTTNARKNIKDKEELISYSQFLRNHPNYLKVVFALAIIFFSYTLVDNFLILKLESIGGSSADLGNIMLVKACLEFPTIFIYNKLEAKIGTIKLLAFASFVFVLKNFIIYIAPSTLLIYAAQLLQSFSFALLTPAIISYINQITDKKESVRGQALYTMAIAVGAIVSSFLSGLIYDNLGLDVFFIIAMVAGLIGAILFTIFINRKEK